MKRFLSFALAAIMTLSLTACGNNADNGSSSAAPESSSQSSSSSTAASTPAERQLVRIAGLKGPTAMGMVKLMEEDANSTTANDYEFTLAGAPDELTGKIINGELDIAAVPTNLAATLYNKTEGKVQLLAVNTLGVLYVVENGDTIHSIADLKGKTIYSTGKGSTPEFALNYILEQNGLKVGTDVTVEYKSEHAELATLLSADQASIAVLPQPFVSSVLAKNEKVRIALDLTKEWDAATKGQSQLTMGAIVVQKQFAEEHPEALKAFMEEYQASTAYVTDPANLDAAAELVGKFEIVPAPVAKVALPACNIVCLTGEEMQKAASGFLEVLHSANAKSVGGKLPDAAFYYMGK